MNRIRCALLLAMASALSGCQEVAGGSSSETSNGLSAVIIDSSGKPAAGALLRVRPVGWLPGVDVGAPPGTVLDLIADSMGQVWVSGGLGADLVLEARAPHGAAYSLRHTTTEVTTLRLQSPATLEGRVRRLSEGGTALVRIVGLDHQVRADSSGRWRIDGLPAGLLRVVASAPAEGTSAARTFGLFPGERTRNADLELRPEPLADWNFRRTVRMRMGTGGLLLDSPVVDVPLHLSLTGADFPSGAHPQGADLRVVAADGQTQLPFEIAHWDTVRQVARLWIRVDHVRPDDSVQGFELRWGRSDARPMAAPFAVFSPSLGYRAVWHLDRPSGPAANSLLDATGQGSDGTILGAPTPEALGTARGLRLSPDRDGLVFPSQRVDLNGNFTALFLVRPQRRGAVLLLRGDSVWQSGSWAFFLANAARPIRRGGWTPTFTAWQNSDSNAYHHAARTVDSASVVHLAARRTLVTQDSGRMEWFIDGVGSPASGGTNAWVAGLERDVLQVGVGSHPAERFAGVIGEIWILDRPMDAGWISLVAASLRDPDRLWILGPVQTETTLP